MKKTYLVILYIIIISFLFWCSNDNEILWTDWKEINIEEQITDLFYTETPERDSFRFNLQPRDWTLAYNNKKYKLSVDNSWKISFSHSGNTIKETDIVHCNDNKFCWWPSSKYLKDIYRVENVKDFAIHVNKNQYDPLKTIFKDSNEWILLFPNFRFEYSFFVKDDFWWYENNQGIYFPWDIFSLWSGNFYEQGESVVPGKNIYYINYTNNEIPTFLNEDITIWADITKNCILKIYNYDQIMDILNDNLLWTWFENMYFSIMLEKADNTNCSWILKDRWFWWDKLIQFMDFDKQLWGVISIYWPHNVENISYIWEY